MRYQVVLSNYRCFPHSLPARFSFNSGGTAGFIGPNNAGKSMALRFFWEFQPLLSQVGGLGGVVEALSGRPQGSSFRGPRDPRDLYHNLNQEGLTFDLELSDFEVDQSPIPTVTRLVVRVSRDGGAWTAEAFCGKHRVDLFDSNVRFDGTTLRIAGGPVADFGMMAKAFAALSSSLYLGSARNAVTVTGDEPYFGLQIGKAFVTSWRNFKTGTNKTDNETAFELQDEVARLFGFEQLDVSASSDGATLLVIVNRKPYELSELGSGFSHIFISLAFAATQKPKLILIDEPELSLHPALQLEFISALRRYAGEALLFSTHSVGLARAAAEQLFSLRRKPPGVSEMRPWESKPTLSEALGELSFSSYQEMGYEILVLAEGRTDAEVIRVFLRKLGLDRRALVLSLGGSSLIGEHSSDELGELARITAHGAIAVHALIDSERISAGQPLSPDRLAFVNACTVAGINCTVLARRALENYLSQTAIQETLRSDKYNQLGPFDKFEGKTLGWSKNQNAEIASRMSFEEIRETDLGEFFLRLHPTV